MYQSCRPHTSRRVDVNYFSIQKLLGEVFEPKVSGNMRLLTLLASLASLYVSM